VAFRFRAHGTKAYSRFGIVHASIGTLSAAALALRTPRRTAAPFANASSSFPATLVTIHHDGLSGRVQASPFLSGVSNFAHVHAGTHRPSRRFSPNTSLLPSPSFYELKGQSVTLEGPGGRVRNHSVATTRPTDSRSLEVLWSALCRRGSDSIWDRWSDGLGFIFAEIPSSLNERTLPSFSLQASLYVGSSVHTAAAKLNPTVCDPYFSDPISRHSPTRGECSLFLHELDTAFPRERLIFFAPFPFLTLSNDPSSKLTKAKR
jgi:hypothetical protein